MRGRKGPLANWLHWMTFGRYGIDIPVIKGERAGGGAMAVIHGKGKGEGPCIHCGGPTGFKDAWGSFSHWAEPGRACRTVETAEKTKKEGDVKRYELERFKSHFMDSVQVTASNGIRKTTMFLAEQVLTDTPQGREQALALENLEQALMWANKAIALHPLNYQAGMGTKETPERERG